jgi:hypothetical protein
MKYLKYVGVAALAILVATCLRPQRSAAAGTGVPPAAAVAVSSTDAVSSAHPDINARQIHPSVNDTRLLAAWAYMQDHERRRREVAIALLQNCIDGSPKSPFLPQVYSLMGSLFVGGENTKLGEEPDGKEAIKYFRLAHEAYGTKYCSDHEYVWASLANITRDVGEQRKHYDWLWYIKGKATADDVFEFQPLDSVMTGVPPIWDRSGREAFLKWQRRVNLDGSIRVAEENTVWMASNAQLVELVRDYPDKGMGKKAAAEIERRKTVDPDAADPHWALESTAGAVESSAALSTQ